MPDNLPTEGYPLGSEIHVTKTRQILMTLVECIGCDTRRWIVSHNISEGVYKLCRSCAARKRDEKEHDANQG